MTYSIPTQNFDDIMQAAFGTTVINVLMSKLDVKYESWNYWYKNEKYSDAKEALLVAAFDQNLINMPEPFFFCSTQQINGREIEAVLGLVSADCAYGMNIFRDIFAGLRDLVGGRSTAVEKVLKDAKTAVQHEMSVQARELGANAIVAVDFDFNELDGGGKNGMLLVSGTGTAVKLKDTD